MNFRFTIFTNSVDSLATNLANSCKHVDKWNKKYLCKRLQYEEKIRYQFQILPFS